MARRRTSSLELRLDDDMPDASRLAVLLVAVIAALGIAPLGAAAASGASSSEVIGGADRYETAALVSQKLKPGGAATVFVASGAVPADALAAGPAAGSVDAPILLTAYDRLPDATRRELIRLKPSRVVIVGSTPSVSEMTRQAIADAVPDAKIERIAGPDRQSTAAALRTRFLPDASEVFLVNGWTFPDAVSASAAGARHGIPILLATRTELPQATRDALAAAHASTITVVGDTPSVGDRAARLASRASGGAGWSRIAGPDRYATNGSLVQRYFDPPGGDGVAIATGENFPDALVASAYGRVGVPVLLSLPGCTTEPVRRQIARLAADDGEPVRVIGRSVAAGSWATACSPGPGPQARTCSISGALADPNALTASDVTALGGTSATLLDRGGRQMVPAGSTMKLVTAVAAYQVLGPDFRILTSLYPGTAPGSVVLVGSGDPTLRRGWSSYYDDAPTVIALEHSAQAVGARTASYESAFDGPAWNPGWAQVERTDGYMAPMSALMLDGGRQNPNASVSPRSSDPAWDAGAAFANDAGLAFDPSIRVRPGSAPIGTVASAPLRTLVSQMLLDSDNQLAEAIARQVSIRLGYGSSWDRVPWAQHDALDSLGIDRSVGLSAADGSGLSRDSNLAPALMDQVLELIDDRVGSFGEIVDMLPVNQAKGTLVARLGGIPAGSVSAKTGWVDYGYGLAGFIWLPNGQHLRIAVYVWKDRGGSFVGTANRDALDRIVEATYRCGTQLAG